MTDSKIDVNLEVEEKSDRSDDIECVLRWEDVRLIVPDPKKDGATKTILNGITGHANKGELMGIIGASGGGKTSLLSMIGGRMKAIESLSSNSTTLGMVELNGYSGSFSKDYTFTYLRDGIAYVLQEDLLLGTEKTKEAIEVSALLRINNTMSKQDKLLKVSQIMEDLDLIKVSDTYIGDKRLRGISGGEKKRVSIAIELVTSPNILILDEPTSGLDSAIAYETVKLLSNLSRKNNGNCIIASIHQPSSEIFSLLDRVLILAKGSVVYEGYVKKELPDYLLSIGYECPEYSNIADYVLQQVHVNPEHFIDKWKEHLENVKKNNGIRPIGDSNELTEEFSKRKFYMAPLGLQLSVLLKRSVLALVRNKILTVVRLGQAVFTGLLQGLLWYRLKNLNSFDNQNNTKASTNAQDRFGGIFYSVAFCAMNSIMTNNLVFPSYRLVFQKERSANWYNTVIWVLCKTLLDFPMTLLVVLPFALIVKYMCNFRAEYIEIFLALFLVAIVADSIGFLVGVVAKRPDIAVQLTPVTIIPLMLFSNFFVNTNNIPIFLRWIKWIDPFFYSTELFSIKEFHGVQAGNNLLSRYGMNNSNYNRDIYAMIGLAIGYRILGIILLFIKNGI